MDMIQDDVIRTAVLQIYAVASRDTQTRPADQANQQQARDTADSGDNGEPVDSLAPSTNDLIHSSLYLLMVAVLPLWQTASFRNPPPSPSRWPPTVISGFMRLLLRMQSFKPISQRLAAGVAEARELLRELATGEAESGAGGTVEGTAAVAAVVAEAAAPTAAPEPAAPLRRANAEELVRLLVSELTKSHRFLTAFMCFSNQQDALLHDEGDPRQHQSPRGGGGGGVVHRRPGGCPGGQPHSGAHRPGSGHRPGAGGSNSGGGRDGRGGRRGSRQGSGWRGSCGNVAARHGRGRHQRVH
ncbi:hypothetical protein PLESTM_001496600 [Pleodorina starrii]|nr:hypothetical protein PLESTM_001496600 [Pleodorina starrii]